jgi:hypothetical protein
MGSLLRRRHGVGRQIRKRVDEPLTEIMRKSALFFAASLLAFAAIGCGRSPSATARTEAAPAKPAPPPIPADVQAAAESALGSEAEVLVYGDLAKNGHREILAVNRLKTTPQGTVPGTLVTRVAVLENDVGAWKEVFRCDEHLKNTNGYLGGTPLAAVTGWRLQYEEDSQKGLQMYFTPLAKPEGGYVQTIGVRWNPKLKRYQSLDRNFEQFLGEVPALETPQSQIRR